MYRDLLAHEKKKTMNRFFFSFGLLTAILLVVHGIVIYGVNIDFKH